MSDLSGNTVVLIILTVIVFLVIIPVLYKILDHIKELEQHIRNNDIMIDTLLKELNDEGY